MNRKRRRSSLGLFIAISAYCVATFIVLTRPGAVLDGDQRIVVRIAHWQIEAGPPEAIDALIKRYEELNPQVRVEQIAVPGNVYTQWLRTQLIGGNSADLIEFGSFIGGVNDIPPRFFDPISSYVEEPNPYNAGTPLAGVRWRDTFGDGLNATDNYIENLSNYYAVPLCMVSMRLFYNEELLQKLSGEAKPPGTFTKLLALGDQLAVRNATADTRISLLAGSQFNGMLLMSSLISYSSINVSMNLDRFRQQGVDARDAALEFFRDGWSFHRPEFSTGLANARKGASYLRAGFRQLDRDAAVQEFLRGRALMIMTGTWDATSLRKLATFKVGVTKFPYPTRADEPYGRYAWTPITEGAGGGGMAFYLNKASKHKAAAIDFLRFITSVEGNTIFTNKSGWLPVTRGVEVPDYAKIYLPDFDGYTVRTDYSRGFGAETRETWEQQLHHLIAPHGGVETFLKALDAEFPAALERDVRMDARNVFLSLRRDLSPLTALAVLDRMEGVDPGRVRSREEREGSQNLSEARLYESVAVLAWRRDVAGP